MVSIDKEYRLSRVFLSAYNDLSTFNNKRNHDLKIENYDLLEATLTNYLHKVMGYRMDYQDYYVEAKRYFENIFINNNNCYSFDALINIINEYGDRFIEEIELRPLTKTFIEAMKEIYTDDYAGVSVINKGKTYIITRKARPNEEPMPSVLINDIDELEDTLVTLIECTKNSRLKYGEVLSNIEGLDGIKVFFTWIIKNATCDDLSNVIDYFKMYTDFITDTTFEKLRKPTRLGNLLDGELYVCLGTSDVAYESPYYLSFAILKDKKWIEIPNIRFGVKDHKGEKVAHILATQTSQRDNDVEITKTLTEEFKKRMPKSKYFRCFNPSHLGSLVLTMGLFKSAGINKVEVVDYLPLRYKRYIQEGRMNAYELENYQKRVTDKNIANYMRLMEFTDGIKLINYPEQNTNLIFEIDDEMKFENNKFLESLLELGKNVDIKSHEKGMNNF